MNKTENIIAIIQARMSSTRLPGKVLLPLKENYRVLDSVYNRISKSELIDKVIVATSNKRSDDEIVSYCNKNQYSVSRGPLGDVLKRVYDVARFEKADIIVRVTADCPLVSPNLADKLIKFFIENKLDFAGINQEELASGLSVEVFTYNALKIAQTQAEGLNREHVTSYIYNNQNEFKCSRMSPPKIYKKTENYRLTLDTEADYKVIKPIFESCSSFINIKKLLNFLLNNPKIVKLNRKEKGTFS